MMKPLSHPLTRILFPILILLACLVLAVLVPGSMLDIQRQLIIQQMEEKVRQAQDMETENRIVIAPVLIRPEMQYQGFCRLVGTLAGTTKYKISLTPIETK